MEMEESQSPQKTSLLHTHRLNHNPSKLPAFRFADLTRAHSIVSPPALLSPEQESAPTSVSSPQYATEVKQRTTSSPDYFVKSSTISNPVISLPLTGEKSGVAAGASKTPLNEFKSAFAQAPLPTPASIPRSSQDRRTRRAPASRSSNGIETSTGPPRALSTNRSFAAESARSPNTSTTEWALAQQQLAFESNKLPASSIENPVNTTPNSIPRQSRTSTARSIDESSLSRSVIPPIRSFKSSAKRNSVEMYARNTHRYESPPEEDQDNEGDRDRTLRVLEGLSDDRQEQYQSPSNRIDDRDQRQASTLGDDLFLDLARDDMTRRANDEGGSTAPTERRKSRIAISSNRQSAPSAALLYQQFSPVSMPRRSSDLQGIWNSPGEDRLVQQPRPETSLYQSSPRDRQISSSIQPPSDLGRSRYVPRASLSTPSTPKTTNVREAGTESPMLPTSRRPSVPDATFNTPPRTHSYRQSNLSYSKPRNYNSSPLVARTIEVEDSPEAPDTPRAIEGTESTVSTTAPSTVWDELDDLKSRIRKLELTGKLPATSGAAVSQATGERPPTATTTNTTMSTSPKRGRAVSTSPAESQTIAGAITETHPLLHSALAKTKSLLPAEVYKALEATASDALSMASMMGSAGQPGPMSSAQSVVGNSSSNVSERQLRRKADSMCRNLTELCLALSEVKPSEQGQQSINQALPRSVSMDREFGPLDGSQRTPTATTDTLSRIKASPRAVSRLEARRSSMLANSALPSPRFASLEASTPPQSGMAGRRSSLLIRSRRAGTEELDEDEQTMFRAPSRATTEIGRIGGSLRNSPRDYAPQPRDDGRAPSVQSNLPVRRHYASTSLTSTITTSPTVSNIGGRRFLDRSTPDRDATTTVSRITEERGQRQYEGRGLGRTTSMAIDRRARTINGTETSMGGQVGGFQ